MFHQSCACIWLFTLRLPAVVPFSPPPTRANVRGEPLTNHKHNEYLSFSRKILLPMTASSTTDEEGTRDAPSADANARVHTKRLLCIRHGVSVANEWMNEPGNEWGDPNFRESGQPDAPLSETGHQATKDFLAQQFQSQPQLAKLLQEVEVVLVSPLTRCLETYQYGVAPHLEKAQQAQQKVKGPIVAAVPLLRERVYTTSDTGRYASVLVKEFASVDFSECPSVDQPWWYTGDEDSYEEWRPDGENQWYGVRGEPEEDFAERMKELDEWIGNRRETTILVVAHWGVLRHMTKGTEWKNAEAKVLEHTFCPVKRTSVVAHLQSM